LKVVKPTSHDVLAVGKKNSIVTSGTVLSYHLPHLRSIELAPIADLPEGEV
jgi:hypothetical protein